MPRWLVDFTKEGEGDLEKLDKSVKERILIRVKWLRENFDKINPLPLGYGWQGFFKLRVGDWRIIYEIEFPKNKITIHYIGRRDKIYKLPGVRLV